MRILGAHILSFLAGKLKKRRMRILGARIFSKFFGGKIKNFGIGYPVNKVKQSIQII